MKGTDLQFSPSMAELEAIVNRLIVCIVESTHSLPRVMYIAYVHMYVITIHMLQDSTFKQILKTSVVIPANGQCGDVMLIQLMLPSNQRCYKHMHIWLWDGCMYI